MTLRARLGQLFGFKPAKENAPGYADYVVSNPYRLEALALDYPKAMRKVGIVRSCVLRVANDLAQLPVLFERQSGKDWTALERTPGNIVDVWQGANDQQTGVELVRDLHAHLKASGNAYLVAETFGTRKVRELWLLPPHRVRVVPGKRRSASVYLFDPGDGEQAIPGEWVIHFKGYNPDFEPYGASDLESVELQYAYRYDIGRLMQLFVRGGGMPAGFFKVIGADGKPSAMAMTEPDRKRLTEQISAAFTGLATAFRPKVMTQVEFARLGLTPDEMKLIEQSRLADEDICRALGVPPWMVGIKDSGNLGGSTGSASADRGIYVRNTLLPEVALRDAVLTERLCPMFEANVRARTDLSSVVELWQPLLNAATQSVALTGAPVLTTNELRKAFALPPDPSPESDQLREPKTFDLGGFGGKSEEPSAPEPKPAPTEEKKARRMIEGDEMREERRRRASAQLTRYERKLARIFGGILDDQRDRVIANLREDAGLPGAAKRAINVDEVIQPDPDDQERLERALADLVRDRGEEALADLALQLQLNATSSRAASFVRSQSQRVLALIDATTREAVRKQIADGLALNETTGQIVERIRNMPEFGQARALTIARTETVSAYNFATVDAYEQSGVVESVEWLSARDSAVRESHAQADGQVVALGQAFDVGGSALSFPGDPGGPPEETINCRCTTLPVVNEKARARRQFKQQFPQLFGMKREGARS